MENQNPASQAFSPPPPPLPPLPAPEEPDSKRLKTSTTTNSDNQDHTTNTSTTERKPRYKRRKVAILFAYCGVGYQGMQKNPGAKTIEGDLEEALFFSGAVPESERGCPNRYDLARSARTDKGVSAVGQVVSGKFYVDPPGFVERLNSYLPPQFRIFGYKRVTASFGAKKFCDRRRYVYLLPVFALDPSSHRDRDCLECSKRGWKFYGCSEGEIQPGISSNTSCALSDSNGNGCKEGLNSESVIVDSNSDAVNSVGDGDGEELWKGGVFSYGEEERGSTTVAVDGIEFVKCEVVGQSFMLHQVRKMIGVAVAIMRNCAPESLIETALQQDVRITVPTAPEVGLYLDECFFSSYNQKWKDTHEEVSMKAYADEAEEFKLKHIYSHIASTEHKEGAVAVWLHSLNHRSYPDLAPEEKGGANEVPSTQPE
ncbi:hypothetical protein L1987_65306 [Smallanthus sonchifolius]|uniref:Uncharacterized protein n=1 Tax=Smallanthus sonchifolius TaxID=185202 RepID=A0ACB9BU34_9ASTR|nr:hypothetical protein L1987_65306 [Smallanthus sonchifolius]